MSGQENWSVGDYALCVRDGPIRCPLCGLTHSGRQSLRKGQIAQVHYIGSLRPDNRDLNCGPQCLGFVAGREGLALRFRKVTPEEADEFDTEIIELMSTQPEPAEA